MTRRLPAGAVRVDLRRLLVVRLDNMGDVILTGPALRAVKETFPGCRITLLASPAGARAAPLLPQVDEVLEWRALWQEVGERHFPPDAEWKLVAMLRSRDFQAAAILTSFNQTPYPPAMACLLAGIPHRLGESTECEPSLLTHMPLPAPESLHQAERNLRLMELLGASPANPDLEVRPGAAAESEALHLLPEAATRPYLVVAPWASAPARTYPPARLAVAARLLSEATEMTAVLVGSAGDAPAARTLLASMSPGTVDLVGRTSIGALAALIRRATLVLTNNSLPLHLADAWGVPQVVTYSGTDLESQWHPRRSPTIILRRFTWCHPCYAITCPFALECLDIPSEEVAQQGLDLLQEAEGLDSATEREGPTP